MPHLGFTKVVSISLLAKVAMHTANCTDRSTSASRERSSCLLSLSTVHAPLSRIRHGWRTDPDEVQRRCPG